VQPFAFTDRAGRVWHVYDFRILQGRRRAVPIGDWRAEARAFVAVDDGTVLVKAFGPVSYRETEGRFLEGQLRFARPLDALAGERIDRPMTAP
jgi:hypothetical protein